MMKKEQLLLVFLFRHTLQSLIGKHLCRLIKNETYMHIRFCMCDDDNRCVLAVITRVNREATEGSEKEYCTSLEKSQKVR